MGKTASLPDKRAAWFVSCCDAFAGCLAGLRGTMSGKQPSIRTFFKKKNAYLEYNAKVT